jgi:hypothetical protein
MAPRRVSPQPLTPHAASSVCVYASLIMSRPPRVLSASVVPWEDYGWGISVYYDDGKRVALYVGSLADTESQIVEIEGDTAAAARIQEGLL